MADAVWTVVMFDLPTVTREQRREATRYRHMLLDYGFVMLQYSVYAKYLVNATGLRPLIPHLKGRVPVDGEVRVLRLTDEQWAGMYRYYGPKTLDVEERPTQLLLIEDDDENDSTDTGNRATTSKRPQKPKGAPPKSGDLTWAGTLFDARPEA